MKNNNVSNSEILQKVNRESEKFDRESDSSCGIFNIKTATETLKEANQMQIPKKLFGEFFHEGELCFLFADTNIGKSLLAVQIANSISRGEEIKPLKIEAGAQKVIYFDFELSTKQFENRYSENYKNHYEFNDNFLRAELDLERLSSTEIEKGIDFEKLLINNLELAIKDYQAKIIIIDNLTYLGNQLEEGKKALPLIKRFHNLTRDLNVSILILGHTPKRDLTKALTVNCLAGSKQFINFCDSAFAINKSCKDSSLRYLKQIKARATEVLYDSDNVIVFEVSKPSNFLKFDFVEFGSETEHLRNFTENERSQLEENILALKESEPNLSVRKIAEQLGTNNNKVQRTLAKFKEPF
ncbi:MAG: LuxR family transcriptional regulator [Calditrichaeota bacterium]|nr:MAG: LuxR family transcriptional regulator [Calditrichota bacterium]